MLIHPDTIPGLAPDCRRVLRADYDAIDAAKKMAEAVCNMCKPWGLCRTHDLQAAADSDAGVTSFAARKSRAIADATREYRRTAAAWGVDVDAPTSKAAAVAEREA